MYMDIDSIKNLQLQFHNQYESPIQLILPSNVKTYIYNQTEDKYVILTDFNATLEVD
jgi:hypothetical protein